MSGWSRAGRMVPYELDAALPVAIVHKFGINTSIGSSLETVWLAGGLYDWAITAGPATISSAGGAADAGVMVTVEGLVGGDVASEEVALDGTGAATTSASFSRIWRAWTSGSTATSGLVSVTIGAVTVATYSSDIQQTQQCIYTIPDGHTGFIVGSMPGCGKNDELKVEIFTRSPGGVFRSRDTALVYAGSEHSVYQVPGYGAWTGMRCVAGTDIDVRASSASGAVGSVRIHIVVFAGQM